MVLTVCESDSNELVFDIVAIVSTEQSEASHKRGLEFNN